MYLFPSFLLFLIGAIFGTLGDLSHVLSETDGYPPSSWIISGFKQPIWVPFLFGAAGLSIGLSHPLIARIARMRQTQITDLRRSILGGICFLGIYFLSGFLPLETGGAKDIFLFGSAVFLWAIFNKTFYGLILAIGTALIGTAVEIYLTHSGAFYYTPKAANFYGVPSWLPWLYITASIAVGNLGRYLLDQKRNPI